MRHTNVFVTVGRASPKPVCTVNAENPNHDFLIDQAQRQEFASLTAGGVDAGRITFTQETVNIPEPVEVTATVTREPIRGVSAVAKPKRGKT